MKLKFWWKETDAKEMKRIITSEVLWREIGRGDRELGEAE